MKFLIISIFFFSISFGQFAKSDSTFVQHKKIGFDKVQHAAVSCLLTLSSQYIMVNKGNVDENEALAYSISSSALIGLTKELNDQQKGKRPFDWGDMVANGVGIAIAVLIISN